MYTIETLDCWEDWYVAEGSVGTYLELEQAIVAFSEELNLARTEEDYASGLLDYINDLEIEEGDDAFGGGVSIYLRKNGDDVAVKHLSYDTSMKKLVENLDIELFPELLSENERNALFHASSDWKSPNTHPEAN